MLCWFFFGLIGRPVFLDLGIEHANERRGVLHEQSEKLRTQSLEGRKICNDRKILRADELLLEYAHLDFELLLFGEELLQDFRYACRILAADNDGGDGGPLSVTSVANVEGNVGVDVPGLYGTFRINANGSFTYDLDETHPALADLDTGMEDLIDELAYDVSDGAAQAAASIRIRIEGVTDE